MTKKVGIREISRNLNALQDYDYVEIEDKKSKKLKGLFVSEALAKEVKEFIENKLKKEKEEKIKDFMSFAGKATIQNEFKNLSGKELKIAVAKAKVGE